MYTIVKTDEEWREQLLPQEYHVLRQAGTERPGTGELLHEDREGTFHCKACDNQLFESGTKFDAHCGWPSFYQALPAAVEYEQDLSHGMVRTEVRCKACGSHLGHVFNDAPDQPTGNRYCMNSVALTFRPAEQ